MLVFLPMVRRFLNLFQRELNGLHEAALLLGISAVLSQILALIRDRLLAASFGAGPELDIYYAAFRLPDLLYVAIGSFVSVTVVLPFLMGHLERGDRQAAEALFLELLRKFLAWMGVLIAAGYLFLPGLVGVMAPGFSPAARAALLPLARILLLSPLLLGLSNLVANLTQSSRQFFLYALSPIFYNLGIIAGIMFFYPRFGLNGLAWGVVLGALGHLLVQWPAVVRGPVSWFGWRRRSRSGGESRQILRLAWPRTLTLSAHQLAILVLVALASHLAAGSIAVFNFAYNLQAVLLSVIGVSYAVAAFPTLVRLFSNGERAQFIDQMAVTVRHIIFWSLPALALFIVLRAQIVRVILGAGKFDWADTRLTAAALAIFLVSTAAQGLILVFVRGYYACGRTRKPLLVNVFSSILIVGLAFGLLRFLALYPSLGLFLGRFLRVADVAGAELLALPLAFTIGMLVNLLIFWLFFHRDFGSWPALVYRSIRQSAVAALGAAAAAYLLLQILAPVFDQSTFWGIFLQGLIAGLGGILTAVFILRRLGNEEAAAISRSLGRRFWRRLSPILPEAEEL
ncbi:MAG: hypothetical protein HYT46_00710 [Candidatus Vogelbacteria bacterium]|nr:hypothetical protein [Candidatus Vogelbacteria bacterium]